MSIMKPRFSLATLLVITTVLAIVAALCATINVQSEPMMGVGVNSSAGLIGTFILDPHAPDLRELALRLLWSWPLAIFMSLSALWIVRRLKSRRYAEPPIE
jgi:hypothetical protein